MRTEPSELPRLQNVRVLAALNSIELFGHERGNIEVFKALRDVGAEVAVGVNAVDDGGAVGEELRDFGFYTFPLILGNQWSWQWLKRDPFFIWWKKAKQVWLSSWAFEKQIKEFQPTHIHLGNSLVYSYLSLALMRCKIPLVYRMGDAPPTDSPFNLRIWKLAIKRTSRIVANSNYIRELIINQRVKANKVNLIYNLAPTSRSKIIDTKQQNSEPNCRIVYVGQLAEAKGVMDLIEAFAQIHAAKLPVVLDLVGGSIYDQSFRNAVKERIAELGLPAQIRLHGQVPNPEFFFRGNCLHVAPSRWEEPMANVVLEAKREGIPSIIYPSGGLPEVVRHQMDGYICREKSIPSLIEALKWMLESPKRLAQMGVAAREDFEIRFNRERFLRQWAEVYRSV